MDCITQVGVDGVLNDFFHLFVDKNCKEVNATNSLNLDNTST